MSDFRVTRLSISSRWPVVVSTVGRLRELHKNRSERRTVLQCLLMDVFLPSKRSEIMGLIRSKGTGPELALEVIVRNAVPRRKVVIHARILPGNPDIYIPSLGVAIFADGCFWHSCPMHGHAPKSRVEYWVPKLAANVVRDRRNTRQLRKMGLSVWRIWEHNLKAGRVAHTSAIIERRLTKRASDMNSDATPRSWRYNLEGR